MWSTARVRRRTGGKRAGRQGAWRAGEQGSGAGPALCIRGPGVMYSLDGDVTPAAPRAGLRRGAQLCVCATMCDMRVFAALNSTAV